MKVLNNLKNEQPIQVGSNLISTPTWIPAFCDIVIKSIFLDISGLFHYGSEDSISRFDFASLIASEFNYSLKLVSPVKLDNLNFYAKRPLNTSLVSAKIKDYIDVDTYDMKYILKVINQTP